MCLIVQGLPNETPVTFSIGLHRVDGDARRGQPQTLTGSRSDSSIRCQFTKPATSILDDQPLRVGTELRDGGESYRVVRVEQPSSEHGFGHAWAEVVK